MADRSVWEEFNDDSFSHKPYVLVYHAGRVGKNKELYKKANEMARLLNCEVVNITKGSYSVEQFVSLFRYATCVVTTSFHAVAFSIIFERPLYAMQLHDGHDSRYVDLLNCIGAQDLLVETDFEPQYRQPDYSVVRTRLADLVEKSRSFLRNQW